jgi:hypothetical protein
MLLNEQSLPPLAHGSLLTSSLHSVISPTMILSAVAYASLSVKSLGAHDSACVFVDAPHKMMMDIIEAIARRFDLSVRIILSYRKVTFGSTPDELLVGVVSFAVVPRVLSKERNIQENESGEKTGKKHDVQLESAVLRGFECDSCKSEYADQSANSSHDR